MRTIRLCRGRGEEGHSHCVMAATSIVAGEDFSDRPSCVCPTIASALIVVNDSCPNESRERLLAHLPWLIIGTRSSDISVAIERAQRFAAWAESAAKTAAERAAERSAERAAANAAKTAEESAEWAAKWVESAAEWAEESAWLAAETAAEWAESAEESAWAAAKWVESAAEWAESAAERSAERAATNAAKTAAEWAWAERAAEWEKSMKRFIDFIEEEIIPLYWEGAREPDYSGLITQELVE